MPPLVNLQGISRASPRPSDVVLSGRRDTAPARSFLQHDME